ncbi:MAG TPA: hypothetical protein VH134_05385 [Candidatus Dormibacteraeota bacterium]|nr:hypothetical protein [Candidatus Dormibacteraeota bacterium]
MDSRVGAPAQTAEGEEGAAGTVELDLWLGVGQPPGLGRQLSLMGAGLLAGGFAAFMLGVLTLGRADPGFPPLSVFGATLMALSAVPPLAASVLNTHRPWISRSTGVSGPLVTFAVATGALAIAAGVAALTA